jgi:uncharacterized protein (TIGR02118 family)
MPKLKMFAAIPRRPDISSQKFHDHWRHPHGTMARRIPLIRKYAQGHQIHCDLLGPDQTRFEGIAEVWVDSIDDAQYFPGEPVYASELVPDEPNFIDLKNLKFLLTTEDVLVSGAARCNELGVGDALWFDDDRAVNIKIIQLVEAENKTPWRNDRDIDLGLQIRALRHVCSSPVAEIHGATPPFIGVRELWWPTLSAFREGVDRAPEAWAELINRPGKAFTALVHSERFK